MANPLYGSENFSTTLNVGGGINNSQTTGIVLTSVSGLSTTGGVLGLDWASTIDTSTYEEIEYSGISGNELTGVIRGSAGTSAKAHANGAVIAAVISKLHNDRLADKLTSRDATVVQDPNGNEILKSSYNASAVNEITVTNAATGNAPQISATGGDTNIDLNLVTKGSGVLKVNGTTLSSTPADGTVTNRKIKLDELQTVTSTTDMNTGSTSYTAHSGLTLTFTPNVASNFLVLLQINNYNGAGTGINSFVVKLDGSVTGNDPLIVRYAVGGDSADTTTSMTQFAFLWITGVSQASHTIQVYGKTNAGGTLHTTYGCLTVIPFSQ